MLFLMILSWSADYTNRQARYETQLTEIIKQLPKWKQERLPPPRVSQSQYDKVGLTRKSMTVFEQLDEGH